MRNITISNLNKNSKEITNYLIKYVNPHYTDTNISIMTGKHTYLNRANYGFAHFRFGSVYFYYTTSVTTDKKTDLQKKIEEDLSDLCFNIREEVLTAPVFSKEKLRILVDTGTHLIDVDRDWCKKHMIDSHDYKGNRVVTVRLPHGFKNKAQLQDDVVVQWNAKYLQHISYSGARSKKGLLRVTVKNKDVVVKTEFFKSTGDFMRRVKNFDKSQSLVQKVANKSGSIKHEGLTLYFEYVDTKANDNGSRKVNSVELRENKKAQVTVNNKINNISSQSLRSNSSDGSHDNYYSISSFIKHDNIYIDNVIDRRTDVRKVESKKVNKLEKIIKSAYKPLVSKDKDLKPNWYEEDLK